MYKLSRALPALLLAAVLTIHPAALFARSDTAAAAEEIEEVETIEEIEVVEDTGPGGESESDKPGLFGTIGRFHPVVLHFPIAWLILLVIVETVYLTGMAGELNRWGLALLVLTLLSFIPAVVSGLGLASTHASSAAEFVDKMHLHRNFNISSGLVLLAALALRLVIGQSAGNKARIGYFILLLAAAGLLGYGSNLGGEMVWGEGFLPIPF
ncbi:MAG: hypothetical protein FVQ81_06065 [Candidatus Glassbacteria bacterium]|nr:hypothetical protein [Candidatus Glassbacteria bacterium]